MLATNSIAYVRRIVLLLPWEQRIGAPERARFGGGEGAAVVALRLVRHSGDEIDDSPPARAVDPDAGFHAIGIAGVPDEYRPTDSHVLGAAGNWSRDLLRGEAVAAVEAILDVAVAAVVAPDLRDERLDR